MRFAVVGAGAVGGVIGGRLFESGHDVVLVARGRHLEAIRSDGLTLASPTGSVVLGSLWSGIRPKPVWGRATS